MFQRDAETLLRLKRVSQSLHRMDPVIWVEPAPRVKRVLWVFPSYQVLFRISG